MQPRRSACSCFSPNLQEFDLPYAPAGANDQRREGGDRILSHDLGTQISPEATAVSCLRSLDTTAFAGSSSSMGSFFWRRFAFDVRKTWAQRVANVRLGFQVKLQSGEGVEQSYLCSASFLILKKTLNEQVEIKTPRIYEKASNPAQWHGRGPAEGGRELIFSVLKATVAFSNCITKAVFEGGSTWGASCALWGSTWGSCGLTPANTHLCSLLWIIQVMSALTQLYLTRLWWLLTRLDVTLTNPRVMQIKRGYQIIFAIVKHRCIKNQPV